MKIYNGISKRKEDFVPMGKNVKMYACGITTSADAHLGHAKQALQFDVIRRYLQFKGYNVTYVRNYTDIDDKIISNAEKAGKPALEYGHYYLDRISKDIAALGIRKADYEPKATETIPEIIEFVDALIKKGYAYVSQENGDVYFIVSKFKDYGKLTNRTLDETKDGSRKVSTTEGKEDTKDFALWKSVKPGEPSWDSPWGKGRPGWHIECSAMCYKFLGETVDIHGGGMDLKFPHHENEIAQSEARFGKPLANYWAHCGLVKVNGVKVSKSLGNGMTIRDALKLYNKEVIKLVILQSNYKSDLNLIDGDFEQAEKHLYKIYKVLDKLKDVECSHSNEYGEIAQKFLDDFVNAMDDDFNTSKAIGGLYGYVSQISSVLKSKNCNEQLLGTYTVLEKTFANVLSLLEYQPKEFIDAINNKYFKLLNIDPKEVDELIELRQKYKANKEYDMADKIKEQLKDLGVVLYDSREGTTYDLDFDKFSKKNEMKV